MYLRLKRYTNNELIPLLKNIFYDYLSNIKNDSNVTYADDIYNEYQSEIKDYKDRIKMYQDGLLDCSISETEKSSLNFQLNYLKSGLEYLEQANMEFQKELYDKTRTTDYCRSCVKIHLNKKINSFYDDFSLDVLFYDNVCTPKGKYEDYRKLITKEERIDFIKNNTEITHLGLVYAPHKQIKAIIGVLGKLNTQDPRVQECGITLLDQKFSDFKNLTLMDISTIKNNDLKQFIQTKIDLDKENMKLLAETNIRGDVYKIYEYIDNGKQTFYIRYVCRGTGRPYYNLLNLNNLKISKEFKKDDYESYAKAWWNLNTLGSPVQGEPIIRL